MEILRALGRHARLLRSFRCAGEVWYEREVEEFIRCDLADEVRARRARGDALLVMDGSRLVAVGAHQACSIPNPAGGGELRVSFLRVIALTASHQGARLASGQRWSDVAMGALVADALAARDREPIVACRVAAENDRSRRLCARFGLTEDPAHELLPSRILGRPARYVWLQGAPSPKLNR